jgi:hypothetical protein
MIIFIPHSNLLFFWSSVQTLFRNKKNNVSDFEKQCLSIKRTCHFLFSLFFGWLQTWNGMDGWINGYQGFCASFLEQIFIYLFFIFFSFEMEAGVCSVDIHKYFWFRCQIIEQSLALHCFGFLEKHRLWLNKSPTLIEWLSFPQGK